MGCMRTALVVWTLIGAADAVRGIRRGTHEARLMRRAGHRASEAAAARANRTAANESWEIDIVIPWSGSPASLPAALAATDVRRERNNGELPYLLRSIATHAPWVHQVWILVDPSPSGAPVEVPTSLSSRTRVVNRCLYMPPGTCPVRNNHPVQAFAHLLPGLAERFIIAHDDVFLGRPVTPANFYDVDGKPYVWRKAPTWGFFKDQECHQVYEDPSVFLLDAPQSSAPSPHFWYPQLKSVSLATQERYPEFYAFVGSHVDGRYSSKVKGPSDAENSQEEDSFGWMNCEMLRTNTGVFKDLNGKRGEWWDEVDQASERAILLAESTHPIFMNINDHFSEAPGAYEMEVGEFHTALDRIFPPEAEVIVVDIES